MIPETRFRIYLLPVWLMLVLFRKILIHYPDPLPFGTGKFLFRLNGRYGEGLTFLNKK